MLDTQNCLQNHIKNAKTIKCLLQSAFYTGSCSKVLLFYIFASNFGISMPTAPHVPASPSLSNSLPPQVFSRYLRNEWKFFKQILAIPSL